MTCWCGDPDCVVVMRCYFCEAAVAKGTVCDECMLEISGL